MSIYQEIFNIINTHVFGGATLTGTQLLAVDLISTTACLFCVVLPFIIVWRVVRFIANI